MKRIIGAVTALSLFLAQGTSALAGGSTINTGVPATGSQLQSAPIRNNFVAAATDINNLMSMFAGASQPASPVTFQLWANPTVNPAPVNIFDGTQFDTLGFLDRSAHTFGAALSSNSIVGDSVISITFSAGKASVSLGVVPNANLANPSTTVNGQTCTLGSTCTISASAGTITPGTTLVASGTPNGLLYDNGGLLGNLATANSGVLVTDGGGVPSISTTLPNVALGTPTSITLTNGTGLPISTGLSGAGSGVLTFLATPSSANLAAAITDETGTGLAVFNTSPTLVTPTLGVATATTINKVTITAPATSATLTIANAKTLTISNSLTFTGTDATSFAFPGSNDTVVTLGATQTLTAKTLTASSNVLGGVTMTLGSDATGDIYYRAAGGLLTRLGIGGAGTVLGVASGIPGWVSASTAATITVGTTAVASCATSGFGLYNNGGTLGCRQSTATYQLLTASSGTYTATAGTGWIEVYEIGGSGGGGGTGSAGGTSAGTAGGDSCWNTAGAACTTPVYKATGGAGGAIGSTTTSANGGSGGSGGNGTGGSSTPAASSTGGEGGWGSPGVASTFTGRGGVGGITSCGALQNQGGDGGTGITGGGGGGGGAGPGCTYFVLTSGFSGNTFTNGAAGAAGASGTGGNVGIAGLAGRTLVIEHPN